MSLAYLKEHGSVAWEPSKVKFGAFDVVDRLVFETDIVGVSRTRQEFADECDINNIMKKYRHTGVLQHLNKGVPSYYDFTETPADLQTALNMMMDAEAAFMRLPSDVRRSMGNDPVEFVKYASDENNIDQMREWGLAAPAPVAEPPMRVEVVNPPAPPAP